MLELLLYITIFSLGIITSFEDAKKGEIKNIYILAALVIGLLLNPLLFLAKEYLIAVLVNTVLAVIVGVAIWKLNLWSAADGKLFIAYSLLIPLSVYFYRSSMIFPSSALLVNTFVPIFLFILIHLIIKTSARDKIAIFKSVFNAKTLLNISLMFFALSWIIDFLFKISSFTINATTKVMLTYIIFIFVFAYIKKKMIVLLSIASILRIILDFNTVFSLKFVTAFLSGILVFLFLIIFIFNLGYFKLNNSLHISELKPKMKPLEGIVVKKGKYEKISLIPSPILFAFISQMREQITQELVFPKNSDTLTQEDIRTIQDLYKNKRIQFDSILIQETLPFAPFLLLGVILTFLFKGDMLVFFKSLLARNN